VLLLLLLQEQLSVCHPRPPSLRLAPSQTLSLSWTKLLFEWQRKSPRRNVVAHALLLVLAVAADFPPLHRRCRHCRPAARDQDQSSSRSRPMHTYTNTTHQV
jgi:hypothetical protein